ncbi:RING/FYVE/PHD zinc finger superfamily protein, partial [Prunus dulcis]
EKLQTQTTGHTGPTSQNKKEQSNTKEDPAPTDGGEARTCNVCSSTSLSSCMHIKPVASLSQAATETDGFSDEVSMGKAAPTSQDFESNSKALVFLSNKANSSEISSLTDIDPNRGFLKFPSKWPEEQAETLSNSMATFRVEDQIGGKKEDDVKCDAVVEEQEAPSQSQPVNCDDGSDVGEDDVKVCDICGDTGREELLATCSRCIDGAEHIYCMQVMMEKVPGDDWMCEDCMHMEESEKQNHNYVKAERVVKGSSLSGIRKNYKNVDASEFKNRLSMKSKCARVEIKTGKAGSTPSIAGKGTTVNAEAVSVSKRRALETSVKLPRVPSFCSKTVLHKDASKKELDKKKIKATTDVISGDRSSSSYLKNAYLPITSDKSDKFRLQMQLRKGALLKSKSFNVIDSKVKGKLSDEGGVQKHKFVNNNATDDNKKKNMPAQCVNLCPLIMPGQTAQIVPIQKLKCHTISRTRRNRRLQIKRTLLSTFVYCASPKVLEVVPKLPQKMLVEEVPRLSTWPTQFVRNHPTEDNIALYFFAEDLESYRRNYKVLVECMVRDDLALRANVDGVELLIFPSNMLPEDSQCWNRMLFLWGVFRGRRVSCSELMQPSRDVNQVDSILKGGQSKQRQEMDFRFFLQGSKRYSIDSVSVDEEPDLKRVKTDESKYSDKGFPFQTDVCGSGFSGDHLGCGKPYDMSVSSTEMQVRTTIGKDQTESQVPGIELSLGAPFIDFEHQKEDRTSNPKLVNNINDEDNEVSTSLSLSLALPSPLGNKY